MDGTYSKVARLDGRFVRRTRKGACALNALYCTLHCSLQVCLNRVPVSVLGNSHSYHDIPRPPGHLPAEPHNYESCGASDAVLPIRFAIPIAFRAADGAGNERLSAHAHPTSMGGNISFCTAFYGHQDGSRGR